MKLLYDLGKSERQALAAEDGGALLYALPYDASREGGGGFLAVTQKAIYRFLDGALVARFPHAELADFYIEKRYGISALIAKERAGGERELCLFTAAACPDRFAMLLPELRALAQGQEPTLTNDEPEVTCPRCGRHLEKGTRICEFCRKDDRQRFRVLFDTTKGVRMILLFPLLVAAVTLAIRFIVPAIQRTAINQYIYPADGVVAGERTQFFVLVASLITVELLRHALGVLSSYLSGLAGNRFGEKLRLLLFCKAESLSLSSIERHSVGYLTERISGDVQTIREFLITFLPRLFSQVLGLFVGVILIFTISPTMSLMVLCPLPLAVLLVLLSYHIAERRRRMDRTVTVRHAMNVQDSLQGERITKAFGQEETAKKRFNRIHHHRTETTAASTIFYSIYDTFLYELIRFGSYLILIFGHLWLFRGEMDVGTISLFTAYAAIFYEPLRSMTSLPTKISAFSTALAQVREILDEEIEIKDAENAATPEIKGHIEVRNVTFGYQAYTPVLRDISLEIRPGEMIGIVGHSGSGKTTLVNLIMRLYDVGKGEILVDGEDVRHIAGAHLRSQIGVVPQETQLFDGTVRENIRYAKPTATDEEVIRAAKIAGAHDFILALPEGYNTMVGDKGYSLSGGERQRVAIARALLHNPKILILDEATASLDTETERTIQGAIERLCEGRTTIAIAHRLSTLRDADRIAVLDHGRLCELGTHRELIEAKGKYYELVMAQVALAQATDA